MHKPLPTGSIITLDSLRHSRKHIPMRTSESIRPTAYPVHARPINTVPEVGTLKIPQYRHLQAFLKLPPPRAPPEIGPLAVTFGDVGAKVHQSRTIGRIAVAGYDLHGAVDVCLHRTCGQNQTS